VSVMATLPYPDPRDWRPQRRRKAPVAPGPLVRETIWYEDPAMMLSPTRALIQAIREWPDTGALQVLQDRVIGGTSCFILVSKILYPKRGERMSPSPSRFFY